MVPGGLHSRVQKPRTYKVANRRNLLTMVLGLMSDLASELPQIRPSITRASILHTLAATPQVPSLLEARFVPLLVLVSYNL